MLKKTLKSPLDYKETQPVHPKGNQSWIFIERTDAEAEGPILWPPDVKNWLIWKDLMPGKIEGERRRGQQRMRWLDGITDSIGISLSRRWWRTGKPDLLQSMRLQRVGRDWVTEQQQGSDNIFIGPDTYYISKLPASSKPIKQKLLELQGKWITLPSNPLPIYSESDK